MSRVRFLLGLFLAGLRTRPEPVPLGRFEIQVSPAGVGWVLDFETHKKYPFETGAHAERGLAMLAGEHPPFLLSVPFSNVDARKAR